MRSTRTASSAISTWIVTTSPGNRLLTGPSTMAPSPQTRCSLSYETSSYSQFPLTLRTPFVESTVPLNVRSGLLSLRTSR